MGVWLWMRGGCLSACLSVRRAWHLVEHHVPPVCVEDAIATGHGFVKRDDTHRRRCIPPSRRRRRAKQLCHRALRVQAGPQDPAVDPDQRHLGERENHVQVEESNGSREVALRIREGCARGGGSRGEVEVKDPNHGGSEEGGGIGEEAEEEEWVEAVGEGEGAGGGCVDEI